jgi:hypothetical protein
VGCEGKKAQVRSAGGRLESEYRVADRVAVAAVPQDETALRGWKSGMGVEERWV